MAGRCGTDRLPPHPRPHPRPGLLRLELVSLLAALGYLAVADPHDRSKVMPRCPIKLASGWDCPSCGGLRAIHDLLHGDVQRAFSDNLLLVLLSPILLYLWYQHARALQTGERYEAPAGLAYGLLTMAVAWGILRNLPVWPWKPTRQERPRRRA